MELTLSANRNRQPRSARYLRRPQESDSKTQKQGRRFRRSPESPWTDFEKREEKYYEKALALLMTACTCLSLGLTAFADSTDAVLVPNEAELTTSAEGKTDLVIAVDADVDTLHPPIFPPR